MAQAQTETLGGSIQWWVASLSDRSSTQWARRARAYGEGSWGVLIIASVILVLGVIHMGEVWMSYSFSATSRQFAVVNGMFTCFTAELVFIRKRKEIADAFNSLLSVVNVLEGEGDSETKYLTLQLLQGHPGLSFLKTLMTKELEWWISRFNPITPVMQCPQQAYFTRVAVSARRWRQVNEWYSCVSMLGLLAPPLITGRLEYEMWGADLLGLPVVLVLELLFLSPICFSAYRCFAMVLNATMWCAALFHVLGGRMRGARGREQLLEAVRLHSRLDRAAAAVDTQFSSYILFFFLPMLVGCALATFNVVSGRMDSYCFTPVPLLLLMFLPICVAGQALQDASGLDLGLSAYRGPWLDEDRAARKIRLAVITRAAFPRTATVSGVGQHQGLNMPACQGALKVWFRFLQMLLNFRTSV